MTGSLPLPIPSPTSYPSPPPFPHPSPPPTQLLPARPPHPETSARLFHEPGVPALLLPVGPAARPAVREELGPPRLERAIGVVYRPETELQSHYFQAVLPIQFDEYV